MWNNYGKKLNIVQCVYEDTLKKSLCSFGIREILSAGKVDWYSFDFQEPVK